MSQQSLKQTLKFKFTEAFVLAVSIPDKRERTYTDAHTQGLALRVLNTGLIAYMEKHGIDWKHDFDPMADEAFRKTARKLVTINPMNRLKNVKLSYSAQTREARTMKMAEFMASLVELSHNYFAFRKRAAPKGGELRVFTQPPDFADGSEDSNQKKLRSVVLVYLRLKVGAAKCKTTRYKQAIGVRPRVSNG
jgi:hypothetical protein